MRNRTYGRVICAYCTNEDGSDYWFTRLVPNQKYCNDVHRQLHEAELAGGPILPISRNFKRMSDYSDFRDLSISVAESDEEKEFKRVQRANKREADRNTHSRKTVNPSVLYNFSGEVHREFHDAQERHIEIVKAQYRKKSIYTALLDLLAS